MDRIAPECNLVLQIFDLDTDDVMILPYKGRRPTISPTAFIAENAVIIGDVTIGDDSNIWYGCVLRGDVQSIHVGARTNIQDGTVVHVTHTGQGTWIGDNVTVGHMALLHDCRIEDNAFIGMKACVMDGVVVENNAMVAAGALVTPGKKIPSGQLWAGSPARLMRLLTPEDMAAFQYSADHYVRLSEHYKNTTK